LKFRFSLFITLCFLIASSSSASIAKIYGQEINVNANETKPEFRSEPQIRVRVQKSLRDVFITGTDLKRKFHPNNSTQVFQGRKVIKFNCKNLKRASNFKKPILLASLGSSTGLISLAKEKFKGLLHVVTSRKNDSCDVIHETNIETYISSLLAREMNSVWPIEALKAQAVAARSYALHKMNSGQVKKLAGHETFYHIESSEKHQVSGNYFDGNTNTELAANLTSGYVLLDDKGKLNPIFFHAKCGGKTLRPEQVWQNPLSGYRAVKCPFCKGHGQKDYVNSISLKRWRSFINWSKKKGYLKLIEASDVLKEPRIIPGRIYSRYIRFYLGERMYTLKKGLLRRYFGRFIVPSNNFKIDLSNNKIVLKGSGLGHGVGMCQLGALDLAKKGWGYQKILAHYFPEHELRKVY